MTTATMTPATIDGTAPVTRPRERAVPEGIPFTRIVGVELRKMFDTRSGFWLMASIGILAVVATTAAIIFAPESELTFETFASAIGIPMSIILPMIAVLSVSSEWSQRSSLTTFTLVPARGRVVAAKAVVTLAIGVVSMLTALGVGAVGNLIGTAIAGVDPTWNISVAEFAKIILADEIGMMMGFMLGVLLRNSPAAMVGYFVYALVLPGISNALAASQQWWADNAAWFDLGWATSKLFEDIALTGENWAQLGVTATVWLVLPLAVGLRFLLRSEVK